MAEMVKSEEPWEFVSRYVGFHEGMSDGLVDDTGRVGVLEGSDTPRLLEELVKEILRMLDL